ncbi:hypothetical protein WDU94_013906 [Cyamophila willieti]
MPDRFGATEVDHLNGTPCDQIVAIVENSSALWDRGSRSALWDRGSLYGGDITKDTLDYLRYKSFITSTSINLARLPPTEDAAGHHAARCYFQVQKWRGVNLNPTDWGWKLSSQGLIPITTTMDAAPPTLLRKISCKCKKGCSGGCSGRKAGLHCSVLCQSCGGQTCNNIPDVEIRCSDDEDDPTTDWAPQPSHHLHAIPNPGPPK